MASSRMDVSLTLISFKTTKFLIEVFGLLLLGFGPFLDLTFLSDFSLY